MFDFTDRLIMIYGEDGVKKLEKSKVCVLGIGGVGGHCADALARSGIGNLTFVDKDIVEKSNINRQLVALNSSLGMKKAHVMAERAKDINPNAKIEALDMFYLNKEDLDFSAYDFVIDAIDNVTAKINIALACQEAGVKLISAMGCGNRKDPTLLKIDDIYNTSGCPLCKIMRKELKIRRVNKLKVVYSTEIFVKQQSRTPGSTAFVPPVAGLMLASFVVNEITG